MIRLNVFIQVNESNRNAVLETAKELVAQSLNDKGCIAYDIFESATRKDVLMICETWKDAESLDAHEKAAHFITLVPKLQELGKMKLEKFPTKTNQGLFIQTLICFYPPRKVMQETLFHQCNHCLKK